MSFAITPNGVGKPVGFRSISPSMPLVAGETFTVEDLPVGLVLAEDGASLRTPTGAEVVARSRGEAVRVLKARAEQALLSKLLDAEVALSAGALPEVRAWDRERVK